ncbi:MAG TPA: nucleotidyltransferase family protein [Thiobacillaceae bacterium]|nr:nucleotidyltransferase family protein [Thiobacillaceae bacterium]
MKPFCEPLIEVLTAPEKMADLPMATWDLLLRQARQAGLLSRLAVLAEAYGLTPSLPTAIRRHFSGAATAAARQRQAVAWEARKLDQALSREGIPAVLLKGAAYVMADLPPAQGRLFADIDILVPKAAVDRTESTLMLHGWVSSHHSAYDQRYYRRWMHELPPMTHIRRKSQLDVHHNLLPETARLRTHPDLVIAASQPIAGFQSLRVPGLEDLVLHSATHLFHEGEWGHALRDLVDLDALLRHGMSQSDWWDGLLRRGIELGLAGPLGLALRYSAKLLHTPVPGELFAAIAPPGWTGIKLIQDALFLRGFASAHHSCHRPGNSLATFALYVRSHALRMPLYLLLPHLLNKAWRGVFPESEKTSK